jgi:hypothetical protein
VLCSDNSLAQLGQTPYGLHLRLISFVLTAELIAAKLTALIRMDDHQVFGPYAPKSYRQRIQHQARLHARPHTPANYRTRLQAQYGRKIQPALMRADIRDIRHLCMVWLVML